MQLLSQTSAHLLSVPSPTHLKQNLKALFHKPGKGVNEFLDIFDLYKLLECNMKPTLTGLCCALLFLFWSRIKGTLCRVCPLNYNVESWKHVLPIFGNLIELTLLWKNLRTYFKFLWNCFWGLIWCGKKWAALSSMSKNDLFVYTLGILEIYRKLAAHKVF